MRVFSLGVPGVDWIVSHKRAVTVAVQYISTVSQSGCTQSSPHTWPHVTRTLTNVSCRIAIF